MKSVALVLTAILACASPALSATPAATEIHVSGDGSVSVMPDQALVSAVISTNSASSQDATSRNNTIYESVVRAVTATGVARNEIALSTYGINYVAKPAILPPPEQRERYGFTVTRRFTVRSRDIARAGAIVDALTRAGITEIGAVEFTVADVKGPRAKALALAMDDARSQAEALAAGAHLHIVGVKSIEYGGGEGVPRPMMMASARVAAPTQLDPGSQAVQTSVTVVFLAEP